MDGLFKYFPVALDKVEMLARRQIQLTPPKYFNDPWDFRAPREPITDDEIQALLERMQREHPSNISFAEWKEWVTRPDYVARQGPEMQDGMSEIVGVVSMTSDPHNRLMWAYYADSHRGFVVEFAHRSPNEPHEVEAVLSPFGLAAKVAYEPTLQKLKVDFSNAFEVCHTKHREWEHEDEWRVVRNLADAVAEPRDGKTFYLLRFDPEDLVRVIFGLRVDPALEKRLSQMLDTEEFAHVKREKMKIDPSSGELGWSEIR